MRGSRYGYGLRLYGYGSAAAAGAIGLATGAIVGGAIAAQAQPAMPARYCAQRYRSYDPAFGHLSRL